MARQDPDRGELLKKLAGRPVIASVSGGKDSAALSLWLTEMEIEHTRCFQDTGWESQILYDYLRGPLTAKIGPITEIHSKKYPGGMADLVRGRGMFPSRLRRMCTQELKVFPARDYIAAQQDLHGEVINAVGIRGEESESRSKMLEWEWNDTFDCEVWRPLINWTEADVIAIHQRHGLAPCPLYLGVKGADGGIHHVERVGCFPCIFARKAEIRMVSQIDPARVELIRQLEVETIKTAGAFRAMFQARTGRGGEPWPIDRVIEWSKTETRKADLEPFEDPDRGCMRWGMCDTAGGAVDACSLPAATEDNDNHGKETTMNYVSRVESNIKRGCAVDLGPKTLIVGPNGAGKSTIVNAIELALTGRASDVAGRDTLAKDAELATLIRAGDAEGYATVTLAEGGQASWTLTPGSKAKRSGIEVSASVFPLRDVRENLAGSPETARKWLLGHLAAGATWETVLAAIPEALHSRVSTLAGGTILGLPTALETARKMARDETRRGDALRESARLASAGLPPPMTEAEIETARAAATGAFREALATAQAAGRLALERKVKAEAEVKDLEIQLAGMAAPGALATVGAAMITVLRGQISSGAKKCGLCGGEASNPTARVGQIEAAIRASTEAGARRAAVSERLDTARRQVADASQEAGRLAGEVSRLKTVIAAAPEPGIAVERRARWEQVQAQEAEALRAQRTATGWTELVEALAGTVSRIVGSARAEFEARVQDHMPSGYTFGLDLTDSAVRFGLRDGAGAVRSALSGAEWALTTAALAAAVAPPGGLSIVVPEDRPFDPATLAAVLTVFVPATSQVIVASPTMPTEVPPGWTVIAVGGPVAAAAAAPEAVSQTVASPPETPAKRKRGRPSKAELAARAAAAAPATGDGGALTPFAPYTPPRPCPGCGVDLNVPEIVHSKACRPPDAGDVASLFD